MAAIRLFITLQRRVIQRNALSFLSLQAVTPAIKRRGAINATFRNHLKIFCC
jgi:hypothetical protein